MNVRIVGPLGGQNVELFPGLPLELGGDQHVGDIDAGRIVGGSISTVRCNS
jgi:hypothetical protein